MYDEAMNSRNKKMLQSLLLQNISQQENYFRVKKL